jgi:hypothetical protein
MAMSTAAIAASILFFKLLMLATTVGYTHSLTYTYRKKSQGATSGDMASQEMAPAWPVHQFGKC